MGTGTEDTKIDRIFMRWFLKELSANRQELRNKKRSTNVFMHDGQQNGCMWFYLQLCFPIKPWRTCLGPFLPARERNLKWKNVSRVVAYLKRLKNPTHMWYWVQELIPRPQRRKDSKLRTTVTLTDSPDIIYWRIPKKSIGLAILTDSMRHLV